jgi:hypothetical protein
MRVSVRSFVTAAMCIGLGLSALALSDSASAASSTASRTAHKAAPKTASKTAARKSSVHRVSHSRKPVHRVDPGFAARDAYYSGDIAKAYPLAVEAGEHWVAALSAYRLDDFTSAYDLFKQVANDTAGDSWLRSGAAFWASRAAVAAGLPDEEAGWLTQAAANPWTFYGMVA